MHVYFVLAKSGWLKKLILFCAVHLNFHLSASISPCFCTYRIIPFANLIVFKFYSNLRHIYLLRIMKILIWLSCKMFFKILMSKIISCLDVKLTVLSHFIFENICYFLLNYYFFAKKLTIIMTFYCLIIVVNFKTSHLLNNFRCLYLRGLSYSSSLLISVRKFLLSYFPFFLYQFLLSWIGVILITMCLNYKINCYLT